MTKVADRNIRIRIEDSFGKVIGYKADTFWTLGVKEEAKDHYLSTFQNKKGPYLRNLLNVLEKNNYIGVLEGLGGRFNDKHTLSIVAEDFQSGEELARVGIEGKVAYSIITS